MPKKWCHQIRISFLNAKILLVENEAKWHFKCLNKWHFKHLSILNTKNLFKKLIKGGLKKPSNRQAYDYYLKNQPGSSPNRALLYTYSECLKSECSDFR